jgi:hypothetical protein
MATAQFSLTDKLLQASECNRIVTQRRMNDFAHRYPFPGEEEAQRLGLQPISKNDWSPILQFYRVKTGVCRSMTVIASCATYNDQAWYHVSFSHNKYLPDYHHVTWMRDSFFLANEKVIQVFPPKDQHYNFHPNCLHLWACLEGDVLPDFRTMGLV